MIHTSSVGSYAALRYVRLALLLMIVLTMALTNSGIIWSLLEK